MDTLLMLINGEWVDSESRRYIDVIDPATEETFARVPSATPAEVDQALQAAQRAFPNWGGLSPEQRGVFLWRASTILDGRKEKIGRLMTREQGKPLKEAVSEIEKAVEMLRYYAEEGKRAYGTIVANTDPSDQSFIVKQPVGVVAALSAWNYPVELIGWKAAAALAAGCTMVAKPSSQAPLSPLEYWRCLVDACIPAGVGPDGGDDRGHDVCRQWSHNALNAGSSANWVARPSRPGELPQIEPTQEGCTHWRLAPVPPGWKCRPQARRTDPARMGGGSGAPVIEP